MENTKANTKFEVLDVLRGLAAFSVMWFHFTNGNQDFLKGGWLELSGKYGWLGVEVFFVISGFIIPYSLWRSEYSIKHNWQTFLIKRIIRLHPAYLITIFITVTLWYVSSLVPGFKGQELNLSLFNLILHFSYLTEIFQQPWLSPIFWTLGIEFQYYLLIAFIYPLISSKDTGRRIIFLLLLCILPFLSFQQKSIVFYWLLLFNFGILSFHLLALKINKFEYCFMMSIVSILAWTYLGGLATSVAIATSLIISFIKCSEIGFFTFLGKVSYSVYLIHLPIGGRVINLGLRLGDAIYWKLITLAIAVTLSIFTAYLMYVYIEKPTQKWSQSIKYKTY